jgi:hypothetical protein
MMDVVPKRHLTASALFLMIAVSLIMIFSGSLDGAAAWANIIALPIAIIGVILTLRGTAGSAPSPDARERDTSPHTVVPDGSRPAVSQFGFGGERQINVAGDYIERGSADRERR